MLYHYGALLRPIGYATVPKGHVGVEPHPQFRHGVVVYDRMLTADEIRHFDLVPIVPIEVIVDLVAEAFRDYPAEYLEEYRDDPRHFEIIVGQEFTKLGAQPEHGKLDRSDLTRLVAKRIKSFL